MAGVCASSLALMAVSGQSSVRGHWPRGQYVSLEIKIADRGPVSLSPFPVENGGESKSRSSGEKVSCLRCRLVRVTGPG